MALDLHNGTMASHNAIQTRTSRWFHSFQGGPGQGLLGLLDRKMAVEMRWKHHPCQLTSIAPNEPLVKRRCWSKGFSWHFASFWDLPAFLAKQCRFRPSNSQFLIPTIHVRVQSTSRRLAAAFVSPLVAIREYRHVLSSAHAKVGIAGSRMRTIHHLFSGHSSDHVVPA